MKYILLAILMTGCATTPVKPPVKRYSRHFNLESSYCPTVSHGEWKRAGDNYLHQPMLSK